MLRTTPRASSEKEPSRDKKLIAPVYNAAVVLGLGRKQRLPTSALSTYVYVNTPMGTVRAYALVDGGAESNFISREWTTKNLSGPNGNCVMASAIDGHMVKTHGRRKLNVAIADSGGKTEK